MSLLALLAPLAAAQDHAVLMLGNSYTAYNDLPALVEAQLVDGVPAWSTVQVQGLSQGGLRLEDHLAKADGSEGDTPWREALVTGTDTWQQVVLQEQSQIPGFTDTSPDLAESVDAAVALDALIAAHGAETVFLMTWGRRDGDSQNDHIYPDFSTMQERLAAGYLAYVEAVSTPERQAWVIPAGLAFQVVHDDLVAAGVDPTDGDTPFTALYTGDGSHPSLEGSTLVAATALASLTGRSPVGTAGPDGVEEDDLARLQDAAARAVFDDAFGEVPYPWAHSWTSWEDTAEDVAVVGGGALRPWIRVTEFGVSLTDLAITDGRLELVDGAGLGAFGAVSLSDGELWITGGSAVLGELTLGGGGELVLSGGTLAVEALTPGTGTFAMTGGQLIVGTLTGDLDQVAGELVAGQAMTLDGDWTFGAEATFLLEGPQGAVIVTGAAVLSGDMDLTHGSLANDDALVVVEATSIDATALEVHLDAAWEWAIEPGGLGERLVLLPPTGLGADTDGDTSTPPGDSGGTGDQGCGCTAIPGAAPGWVLLAVPWWWRRRLTAR